MSARATGTPAPTSSTRRGTLVGATAVLLWATLATLTVLSGDVPPFQLLAMCFALGAGVGVVAQVVMSRLRTADRGPQTADGRQSTSDSQLTSPHRKPSNASGGGLRSAVSGLSFPRLPLSVWALGLYGLFGYHFAYFMALRNAPPVDAGLIAYLWPLLIVLMAALLPGERLRGHQLAGALAGFAGAALLVTRGQGLSLDPQYALGYAFALACALIWSSYSVLSRRAGSVPTSAVGAFCAATAVLALACHLVFEDTLWPVGWQWAAVIALGIGPVGAAFYTWDYGVKRGNIQALGAFAYAAPLLSTLLLVAFGLAEPTWVLAAACALIVGGAVLASGQVQRFYLSRRGEPRAQRD